MILPRMRFLVLLAFVSIEMQLRNSDATLVDLLTDVQNRLAEMQAGEVKLQKEMEALVKSLDKKVINATEMEAELHEVDGKANRILYEVTAHSIQKKIAYVGSAGASSAHSNFPAKYAFQESSHWENAARSGLPQSVWFNFGTSNHVLSKIDIRCNKLDFAPKKFQIVGSNDCRTWSLLLEIEDGGFTSGEQLKSWNIPISNRNAFSCIGLKVFTVNGGSGYTEVRHIVMWK